MKKILIFGASVIILASSFIIGRHTAIMTAELVDYSNDTYSIAYGDSVHEYSIEETQRFIDETQRWLDTH